MPWQEVSVMSQRKEFVMLAQVEDSRLVGAEQISMSEVCRRFGISRVTGYKWLDRYHESGDGGLSDISRRPHHSPLHTAEKVEKAVLGVRDAHPAWGGS